MKTISTEETLRTIVQSWKTKSVAEIAQEVGKSTGAVNAYVKKLRLVGVSLPRHSRSTWLADKEFIKELKSLA